MCGSDVLMGDVRQHELTKSRAGFDPSSSVIKQMIQLVQQCRCQQQSAASVT